MKIKLLEDFVENRKGAIIDVENNIARTLVSNGKAIFPEVKDIAKVSLVEKEFEPELISKISKKKEVKPKKKKVVKQNRKAKKTKK